jgi:hypothetical protein
MKDKMKTKMNLLMVLISFLIVFTNSCKKPKGDKYCTWSSKTTALSCILNCAINDSCKYDSLKMTLRFDTKYMGEWPPCGTYDDSVVGNIESLNIIANYYTGNGTSRDTINDIIKFKINYYNGETISNNLSYINLFHPRCHSYICLFLSSTTDTTCLQSFTISYKESDGTIYTTTTNPIYVTP